jgi:hypothetical protein
MKTLRLFTVVALVVSLQARAVVSESLSVSCQVSDGSEFVFDRFDAEPCRIRRLLGDQVESLGGVSLCLFPDEVRSDFSFWRIVPTSGAKAWLVGELEAQEDGSFAGQYNLGEPESEEPWLELNCVVKP